MLNLSITHDLFPEKEPVASASLAELTGVDVVKIRNLGMKEGVQYFLFVELTEQEAQRARTLHGDDYYVTDAS